MSKTLNARKTVPTTLGIFLACFVFFLIANRVKS